MLSDLSDLSTPVELTGFFLYLPIDTTFILKVGAVVGTIEIPVESGNICIVNKNMMRGLKSPKPFSILTVYFFFFFITVLSLHFLQMNISPIVNALEMSTVVDKISNQSSASSLLTSDDEDLTQPQSMEVQQTPPRVSAVVDNERVDLDADVLTPPQQPLTSSLELSPPSPSVCDMSVTWIGNNTPIGIQNPSSTLCHMNAILQVKN